MPQPPDLDLLLRAVLLGTFALSAVFGAIMHRTGFCTMGAISDVVNMGETTRLRQWAQPLDLTEHPVSYHVLESSDVAHALVRYAEGNHVNMMILGAATHGLQTQRFIATVPMRVARDAPCTVILVKQSLPFARLAGAS